VIYDDISLDPHPISESYLQTIFTGLNQGKTSEPSNVRNIMLFMHIAMPYLGECVPAYLNKFNSTTKTQHVVTDQKVNSLTCPSISLPSKTWCQEFLLCNISNQISEQLPTFRQA